MPDLSLWVPSMIVTCFMYYPVVVTGLARSLAHAGKAVTIFFLLDAAWVRSRAERPSVSYTKVSAVSLGLAKSCKYTNQNKFKQNSGSNKFLIAGDGKMKRMREP